MTFHKLNYLLLPVFVVLQFTTIAQGVHLPSSKTKYSKEVEANIRKVEQGISFVKFVIKGKRAVTLQEKMQFYHVYGLSVAVINNYQIEWVKGYGWADVRTKKAVDTKTLFQPGSISKSLNAMGVLRLVQQQQIDLHADINQYLRSWQFPYDSVSRNKKITVAHLLSHTAGLGVQGFPGYYRGDSFPSIPQILDGTRPANTTGVRSMSEPGIRFEYSGGGTMISQLIQMDMTRQPYDQYMQQHVLSPIGMTSSFFTQPPPADKKSLLAIGYTDAGKHPIKGNYPILIEQAAGGLWTTPTDIAKFIIETQLSAQGKSNKVLNKEKTNLMLTPYIDPRVGLGVFLNDVNGNIYFEHSAGNQGFSGKYIGSLAEGKGVVIFINADYGHAIIDEFINSVAHVYKWKGIFTAQAPIVKEAISIPASLANSYTGVYKEENGTLIEILKKDSVLWYRTAGGAPWRMYFISTSSFINLESKSEKELYTDMNGSIKGFSRTLDGKVLAKAEKLDLKDVPQLLLEKYIGNYRADNGTTANLAVNNKALWLKTEGTIKKVYFFSDTEFVVVEDPGMQYTMVIDRNGKVSGAIARKGDSVVVFTKLK